MKRDYVESLLAGAKPGAGGLVPVIVQAGWETSGGDPSPCYYVIGEELPSEGLGKAFAAAPALAREVLRLLDRVSELEEAIVELQYGDDL